MGVPAELFRPPGAVTSELVFLAVVAGSIALWYLVVFALSLRPRPKPRPGPPTTELGPESPAVANLLTNQFAVTAESAPATLLDLAARGLVEIEEPEPGCFTCRVRSNRAGESLRPYERQVLDLVSARAVDGVVPAGALTLGTAGAAERWTGKFDREVVQDARRLGLCRDYWSSVTARLLFLWMAANIVLACILIDANSEGEASRAMDFALTVVTGAALGAAIVCGKVIAWDRQVATRAGLAAGSRWLGVRDYLRGDEVFPTLPPASVTVWDRYLAHGAALGAAAAAVRALPMRQEDDHRAWSSWGGRWRPVRVDYPGRLPLGWGSRPVAALVKALVPIAAGTASCYAAVRWTPGLLAGLGPAVAAWTEWILFVLLTGSAAVAGAGLWVVACAIPDLWQRRTVTGTVLRLRQKAIRRSEDSVEYVSYVAVDDGSAPRVRAWKVRRELYLSLSEYQTVTATVTPRLRYVRAIGRVSAEAAPGGAGVGASVKGFRLIRSAGPPG